MHLPAPLVHAKYLHGVPSQSIPAAAWRMKVLRAFAAMASMRRSHLPVTTSAHMAREVLSLTAAFRHE